MVPNGSIKENRRVLLIENNQADRLLLRNWLTAERIEVYEAVDIITGLAACSRFQPNLVLVQIRLPTWDGYEVIRRLKDDPRTLSIPVIILSSCATTAEKAKGIDMGAVDFVSKPFDPVELLARVHSALRTKAYLDLLEQRAHIDGLTELSNRYALQNRLPLEWAACRRRGAPLAIMILDLDHFKRINDHYGHAAGDEVLRQMAASLRSSFRETDFIARYGGEEFVVIAPDCDLPCAVMLAERLRVAVADLQIAFRTANIKVTTSIGIAQGLDPALAKPIEALDQADQALYRAKGAGRNAIWIWDPRRKMPVGLESWQSVARVPSRDAAADGDGDGDGDGSREGAPRHQDAEPQPGLIATGPSSC
jgi:diguanylate cyclase (GGDEF)-like protein